MPQEAAIVSNADVLKGRIPSGQEVTTAATTEENKPVTKQPEEKLSDKHTLLDALRYIWKLVDGRLLLIGCLFTIGGVAMSVLVPIRSAALLRAAREGGLTLRAVLGVLGADDFTLVAQILRSFLELHSEAQLLSEEGSRAMTEIVDFLSSWRAE